MEIAKKLISEAKARLKSNQNAYNREMANLKKQHDQRKSHETK